MISKFYSDFPSRKNCTHFLEIIYKTKKKSRTLSEKNIKNCNILTSKVILIELLRLNRLKIDLPKILKITMKFIVKFIICFA